MCMVLMKSRVQSGNFCQYRSSLDAHTLEVYNKKSVRMKSMNLLHIFNTEPPVLEDITSYFMLTSELLSALVNHKNDSQDGRI